MLTNVQQTTIESLVKTIIASCSQVYTDEYAIYSSQTGGIGTKVSVIDKQNMPVMKVVMAFMRYMSIR